MIHCNKSVIIYSRLCLVSFYVLLSRIFNFNCIKIRILIFTTFLFCENDFFDDHIMRLYFWYLRVWFYITLLILHDVRLYHFRLCMIDFSFFVSITILVVISEISNDHVCVSELLGGIICYSVYHDHYSLPDIYYRFLFFIWLTNETVFVINECSITPFLLKHTLNDLFDLQDYLGPLDPPNAIPTTIHTKRVCQKSTYLALPCLGEVEWLWFFIEPS